MTGEILENCGMNAWLDSRRRRVQLG